LDSQTKLEVLAAEFERLAEKRVRSAPEMARLVRELEQEFEDLQRERRELSLLYEVAQCLAATTDLDELLEEIIDRALVLVGGERGFVVLLDEDGNSFVAAARRFSEGEVTSTENAFSSSLMERVMARREPILTTNVQTDGRFELSQSIIMQDIRSVLAVPLVANSVLQGAIYVDTRISCSPFGPEDQRVLQAMASQAGMAIRSARLYSDVTRSNERLRAALDELHETQAQLIQAERLAAVGRLAASVAHELRNPLTVMRNSVYFLERLGARGKLDSPEMLQRYLDKIDNEIERQNKIINDLLFFSRNRPRQMSDVDLNALLQETLMRVTLPESVHVVVNLADGLDPVHADGDQLQQVLVNLCTNAAQAMPDGGTLTVRTRAESCFAVVQVTDTGVGISEEHLQRLFEPFFTTKEKGIGLGLSVTKSIIEGHHGEIEVESWAGEGTCFTVRLPYELVGC
jgi:signal transduction histidine kinase